MTTLPLPASEDLLWWGHKVYLIADSLPNHQAGETLKRVALSRRFEFWFGGQDFFAGCETPGQVTAHDTGDVLANAQA